MSRINSKSIVLTLLVLGAGVFVVTVSLASLTAERVSYPRIVFFLAVVCALELRIQLLHLRVYSFDQATITNRLTIPPDSPIERLRELKDENRRLKQMYADPSLENRALKDVIAKEL